MNGNMARGHRQKMFSIYYSVLIRGKDAGCEESEIVALNKQSAINKLKRVFSHIAAIVAIKNNVPKKEVKVALYDFDGEEQ